MIKSIIKTSSTVIFSGILPFDWSYDIDEIKKTNETAKAFYRRNRDNETGWDRLYLMFSLDEFNNMSPELHSTMQAGFMGLFIGACYGGFIRSRVAYTDFMERNQATAFKSHFDAKKKLQDAVTLSFGKGAFQWGWRLGLFSMSYVGFTTMISVYRGKTGIIEYTAAGAITGSLYKFQLGPRAILVGGILGGALGTIAGVISFGITKLTGMSLEETRYWQYQWKLDRDVHVREAFKKNVENEKHPLAKHHDQVVGETNLTKPLEKIERDV